MTDKTVHVVGGFPEYEIMFTRHGWAIVEDVEDADLVQFCGGADVWPGFYNSVINSKTRFNLDRDKYERKIYELAVQNRCAIAGVCRGAQFVHVMNGGELYQHCDMHAVGGGVHQATVIDPPELVEQFPEQIWVTSTHHQMINDNVGEVIMAAWLSEHKEDGAGELTDPSAYAWDVEAIYHPHSRSFCYQPHPEMVPQTHDCQKFYFKAIKHLLFPKQNEMKEAS